MEQKYDERNKSQIIRQDAKNCFVESKNDAFEIGKIHLEFAAYDTSKPEGQRQTNHVHIYIDVPEFLCLAQEALNGMLHSRARQQRAANNKDPLYQSLGGTSAEKLRQYGYPRADGKSISRIVKLILGSKEDCYLFVADSGPGETDSKGLIVPKFGNSPENHVAVSMDWRAVNEIMMMTKVHYEAWLAAKYMAEIGIGDKALSNAQKNSPPNNSNNVSVNTVKPPAGEDDMQMF